MITFAIAYSLPWPIALAVLALIVLGVFWLVRRG